MLANDASYAFEQTNKLAVEQSLRTQLAHAAHAIQKMEQGTYGLCDTCGQPIEENRLRALPNATQCISCKNRAEHRPA